MVLRRSVVAAVLLSFVSLLAPQAADAACMNKFVRRTEGGNRQVVTLLTGKLTFDEAKALSAAIASHQAPLIEWVDDGGRPISRQFGELKVIRPMPVGCDGRASGVIVVVTFMTVNTPSKRMSVKLDANTTVAFEEQAG
jgi:hypothetical protein